MIIFTFGSGAAHTPHTQQRRPGPAHDSANICKNNSCVNCSSRHSRHTLHNSATHLPLPPQPCTLICSRLSGVSRWQESIDTINDKMFKHFLTLQNCLTALLVLTNFCQLLSLMNIVAEPPVTPDHHCSKNI